MKNNIEMAHITKATAEKLVRKMQLTEGQFYGEIYHKPINCFNQLDIKIIQAFKTFIENPGDFFQNHYQKLPKFSDTYTWVYEAQQPCYHLTNECEMMNRNYVNIEIPEEIKNQGITKVEEYRECAKKWMNLLSEGKQDVFLFRMQNRFGDIFSRNARVLEIENSGTIEMENLDLDELTNEIDDLLDAQKAYYFEHRNILGRFSKRTFLAYRDEDIIDNETGLSVWELKDFLKDFDIRFKNPLKKLLMEYHMVKLNPDLEMSGSLLEQLGLKMCSCCEKEHIHNAQFNVAFSLN